MKPSETKIYNTHDAVGVATDNPPWYKADGFPIVPVVWYRRGDEFNCDDFGFSWLFLTGWTQMSPDISLCVELDDIGFHIRISVPYFRIVFTMRLFPKSWYQKSWRVKRRHYK